MIFWKLNAFLYERAPRLLKILQNFTAMEWMGICVSSVFVLSQLIP